MPRGMFFNISFLFLLYRNIKKIVIGTHKLQTWCVYNENLTQNNKNRPRVSGSTRATIPKLMRENLFRDYYQKYIMQCASKTDQMPGVGISDFPI